MTDEITLERRDPTDVIVILGARFEALRQAAGRVVECWGDPADPLIHPDMGAAVEALAREMEKPL